MALRFTDELISSDVSPHIAHLGPNIGGWEVSYLDGRVMTKGQATTAMMIAEAVIAHAVELDYVFSEWWDRIDLWAAEFGMLGPDAVAAATITPAPE